MKNKLTVSDNFTNLMISFEKEVLKGYLDPVGIPTIGIGHVIQPGENYKIGQAISRAESRKLFAKDTAWAVAAGNRLIDYAVNQNQFDALVSLIFNIGEDGFSHSTVRRETNRGDFEKAAAGFALWNKSRGRVLRGLVRRRAAEAELFLQPAAIGDWQPGATKAADLPNSSGAAAANEKSAAENDCEAKTDETLKTIDAPLSDGATATATKLTIAGLTMPPAIAAIIRIIQEIVAGGFVSAKIVGDGVIAFLNVNYKYVFVGIGILIAFLTIKKLFRQITLWLEMFFAASREYNDVKIKRD